MATGLFIAAIIATILFWIVRKHREEVREREQMLQRLGFQKVLSLDEKLKNQLSELVRRRRLKVRFGNIYRMERGAFTLYRADIQIGDRNRGTAWRHFIVGDRIDLPRLAVMPNIAVPKLLQGLWDSLVTRLVKEVGLNRVERALDNPFSKKYVLFVRPEERDRLPDDATWHRYAEMPDLVSIEARDDILMFGRAVRTGQRGPRQSEENQLRETIALASRLHDLFAQSVRVHA